MTVNKADDHKVNELRFSNNFVEKRSSSFLKALRNQDTIPVPTPNGAELLIRIGACGVCGSDIPRIYVSGTSKQKYPLTIGHEFSGTVVAVGPDADPALLGKRGAVFPLIPCRRSLAEPTVNPLPWM